MSVNEETKLQKSILDAIADAHSADVVAWRVNCGNVQTRHGTRFNGSPAGTPDIIGVARGRFLGLEVKTPEGKTTEAQLKKHDELRAAGACVWVVTSVDEALWAVEELLRDAR